MKGKYEIPEFFKDYLAKPAETLFAHTKALLDKLEELKAVARLSEEEEEILRLCCIYHDIGKINPLFQKRIRDGSPFDPEKEVGHNILSAYLLKEFLDEETERYKLPVLHAVLHHHHYIDNLSFVQEEGKGLIKENLRAIADLLFPESGKNLEKNVEGRIVEILITIRDKPDRRAVLIKGLLHKLDYTASGHHRVEIPNTDLYNRLDNFAKDKAFAWRDVQNHAKACAEENVILIASTGLGKTEASLLWLGNQKGFYVLPLKTAINAMYARIRESFYPEDYEHCLGLLHGEVKSVYLEELYTSEIEEGDKFWKYYELTRSMAMPLTICTPDQVFGFAFKYPSYELQLATYSYAKFIIDEIQAYSPDILATMIYGLQRIVALGGKFAITTATMPPFIKDLLQEGCEQPILYQEAVFINEKIRHRVELRDRILSVDDIFSFVMENQERDSLKVLVVCNTVVEAQNIYRDLSKQLTEEAFACGIELLHSRFIVRDRREKERKILEDGKTECRKKVIWISTQVVEASLDIDFDYLFTELSDLSSLFQRLGRCNRKGQKELADYNVFVYTKIKDRLYRHDKRGLIFHSLFSLSKKALEEWNAGCDQGLMSEKDKLLMMDTHFTTRSIEEYERENCAYSSYLEEYEDAYKRIWDIVPEDLSKEEAQQAFRDILSCKVIPASVYEEEKEHIEGLLTDVRRVKAEMRLEGADKQRLRIELLKFMDALHQLTMSLELRWNVDKSQFIELDREKIYIICDKYSYDLGHYKEENRTRKEAESIFW